MRNSMTKGLNRLNQIVQTRRDRLKAEGDTLGIEVPENRQVPLVTFGQDPFLICEMKRRSPSAGDIQAEADPVEQAGKYFHAGVRSVSVLTEGDFFGGSLKDLMAVKKAYPELAVIRKDFLLTTEDVEVAYRAGADAVLLIAAVLTPEELKSLHQKAEELGLAALVEVHTAEEIEKVRFLKPPLMGINSRDLTTFSIDLLQPVALRRLIDWDCRCVFESGVKGVEHASLAVESGFDGLLVGETVMRNPGLISPLLNRVKNGSAESGNGFWSRVVQRRQPGRPLVKICGITRPEDALAAETAGADLLGFILAPSPRQVSPQQIRSIPKGNIPRIGVVVLNKETDVLPQEIQDLLDDGYLDAVQFHGNETPENCGKMHHDYYKAVRPETAEAFKDLPSFGSPRILVDAFVKGQAGGTGKVADTNIIQAAADAGPLWLAGGINPENCRELTDRFNPELIDLSSGVEASPGVKDHQKIVKLFKELEK